VKIKTKIFDIEILATDEINLKALLLFFESQKIEKYRIGFLFSNEKYFVEINFDNDQFLIDITLIDSPTPAIWQTAPDIDSLLSIYQKWEELQNNGSVK
jgi:hypothetical protein